MSEESKDNRPIEGVTPHGDVKLLKPGDPDFAACKCPYTNGSCASINDLGCDSFNQEVRCGSTGWYRTGNVCPR